jgi:hypothetical protein
MALQCVKEFGYADVEAMLEVGLLNPIPAALHVMDDSSDSTKRVVEITVLGADARGRAALDGIYQWGVKSLVYSYIVFVMHGKFLSRSSPRIKYIKE